MPATSPAIRPRRTLHALGAAALITAAISGIVLLGIATRSPPTDAQVTLVVEDLQVSPLFASSPATIVLRGRIRNLADAPTRHLRIGLAAADPGVGDRWTPLEIEPAAPVDAVQGDAIVPFYGVVRLEGSGRFAVGIVAVSDDAILPPQLRPVWLFGPIDAATEVGTVFLSYLVLLGLGALSWRLLARNPHARGFHVRYRYASVAVTVAVAGPILIWTSRAVVIRVVGPSAPPWVWAELPWVGAAAFAAGWILFGFALRPGGSSARGVALAATLYVLVGLVWTIGLQVAFGRGALATLADRDVMMFSLLWPLQIAQVTGLFGLSY